MQKIECVTGTGVPLLLDDIDTDRIIPARYLRCVTFDGLGEHAFEDDRKQDRDHSFNNPRYQAAGILVVGRNFGCGSSREHAPQALLRWGIRAIVGESFAEIFFGNCTSLGIPCVCAARVDLQELATAITGDPKQAVSVDLKENKVRYTGRSFACSMPEGSRSALVTGEFDFLGQLLAGEAQILKTAGKLPYMTNFA